MGRHGWFVVFPLILVVLLTSMGCGATREDADLLAVQSAPVPSAGARIKVVDVSNNTGEIFSEDVIGLMWSALEETLKKEGLLWTEGSPGAPLELEARIMEYSAGNVLMRYMSPVGGKTHLSVQYDLRDDKGIVANVETSHSYSFGEGFTRGAWRKIFSVAADEAVSKLRAQTRS